MVLWFPSMMCFAGLVLSTACHIIIVGAHLHWHFEKLVVYNFIWKHLFVQTSHTVIACWSFFVVFPICKIVNEPWEDVFFFFTRDFHNISKLRLFWEQALSSEREQRAAWGSQFPGATQLLRYCFHKLARSTGHSATDWLGWAVCLGQQTPLELTLLDLTRQIRTNAHWTYGCTA